MRGVEPTGHARAEGLRGRWPGRRRRPAGFLERIAFIRIHATHSNLLISHVREAQNRFPLLRDML